MMPRQHRAAMKKPLGAEIVSSMINAPSQPSQRQDLKRWENEGGAPRSGHHFPSPNPTPLPQAGPALYYFNIRTENGVVEDPEGDVCLDPHAAHEKALADASALILQGDRVGENRRGWCFEIMDRANQHVLTIMFSEALDPGTNG
jgi:hypothetical protein